MGEYTPDSTLPPTLGSNTPGPHPASITRPIHHPEWDQPSASGYRVSKHVIGEPVPRCDPFKVLIIGAGASGIDFLHHAKTALSGLNVELRCVDKNSDVGGTWLENRYPGCACDVPSASYQFPWRPNPYWSRYYSGAREIWAYMKAVALDEGLTQFMEFGVEVKGATWVDETARWVVKLAKVNGLEWEEQCDVLLNATGVLKYVSFLLGSSHLSCFSLYAHLNTDETVTGNGRIYPVCTAFGGIYFIQPVIPRILTSRENESR